MAVKIRLARGGAKKRPFYSIVVTNARSPRDGRFIEKVGTYNPMLARDNPVRVVIDQERAKYWLGNGAQPTDRVAILFGYAGLLPAPVKRDNPKKSAPKARAQERAKEEAAKAEALKAAAESAS